MSAAYLMTHSLLYSWQYALRENPYEDATTEDTSMPDFLRTLRREDKPPTEAMQKGIDFEDLVTAILTGRKSARYDYRGKDTGRMVEKWYSVPEHPWHDAAYVVSTMIRNAQLQYKARKEISVSGINLLLYGRLDALKAGTVYDIKFSGKYERGKFFDSTQHPVYLELVPEAYQFVYIISDGRNVWTETYYREDTKSIFPVIQDFMSWLNMQGLMETYKQHWLAF